MARYLGLGDLAVVLYEKALRHEPCSVCGVPLVVDAQINLLSCGHAVHDHCYNDNVVCNQNHGYEDRLAIRTLAQEDPALPTQRRGQLPDTLDRTLAVPILTNLQAQQLFGPQPQQEELSGYVCSSCQNQIPLAHAVYRHPPCLQIYDADCVQNFIDQNFGIPDTAHCPFNECPHPLLTTLVRVDRED